MKMSRLLRGFGWLYLVTSIIAFIVTANFDLTIMLAVPIVCFCAARLLDGQDQINEKLDEQAVMLKALSQIVSRKKRELDPLQEPFDLTHI